LSRQTSSCNFRARLDISNCCSSLKKEYAPQTVVRILVTCFLASGLTQTDDFVVYSRVFDVGLVKYVC
jgi:hypothetical protein